ncbi:MAG: serine hydrolase [Acidobacteriota bacterium]|nr:serine hydrolase [Acidobacteriota bacterium]
MNRIARLAFAALLAAPVTLLAQPAATPPTPLQNLKASIERIIGATGADWGIYMKSLETGEEIAINADRPMETASTIKLTLLTEVFEQIKAGKLKLTDQYTVTKADQVGGTGIIQFLDVGDTLTIKDLATLMVIVSDNTATDVLFRAVGGPEVVARRMQQMGFKETRPQWTVHGYFAALTAAPDRLKFNSGPRNRFGQTTAREMGRLLELMERGQLVDKASSDMMLQIMRRQLYRTRIPRYLDGRWQIPHKTGELPPYVADDVGVLERPGHRIVLTVLTDQQAGQGSYEMLEAAIGRVAQQVAEYYEYR